MRPSDNHFRCNKADSRKANTAQPQSHDKQEWPRRRLLKQTSAGCGGGKLQGQRGTWHNEKRHPPGSRKGPKCAHTKPQSLRDRTQGQREPSCSRNLHPPRGHLAGQPSPETGHFTIGTPALTEVLTGGREKRYLRPSRDHRQLPGLSPHPQHPRGAPTLPGGNQGSCLNVASEIKRLGSG